VRRWRYRGRRESRAVNHRAVSRGPDAVGPPPGYYFANQPGAHRSALRVHVQDRAQAVVNMMRTERGRQLVPDLGKAHQYGLVRGTV